MRTFIFVFLIILLFPFDVFPQSQMIEGTINWKGLVKEKYDQDIHEFLYFEDAFADIETGLPVFTTSFELVTKDISIEAVFTNTTYENFSLEEKQYITKSGYSIDSIAIETSVSISRKMPIGVISFIPIRWNATKSQFEKLVTFSISVSTKEESKFSLSSGKNYTENSVLSTGDWYKIRVDESGIYKISYNDLQGYGIDPASINPLDISIYGNGGGMLPENTSGFRYDDLQEIAIEVVGADDGVFNQDDYILFYGMSPHIWEEILGFFTFIINYYDNYNYYYLTLSLEQGKRIELEPSSPATPTHNISTFDDYQVIENDEINLIESGKEWYGDEFGDIKNRSYYFNFPNINTSENAIVKVEIANRTTINETMAININNAYYDTVILTSINPLSTKYAQKKKKTMVYGATDPEFNIDLEYIPGTSTSKAWLDYIMINATSNLVLTDGQLLFRDLYSTQEGAVTEFLVQNSNSNTHIWDITDPINTRLIESDINGTNLTFTVRTDSLREFAAFDRSMFLTPEFVGYTENQNLHGEGPYDNVIITHPLFINEAIQLKGIHDSIGDLTTVVIIHDKIFNEFSSGKQDPTAIRDYMKMLYDKYDGQEPRFLTLFGDGSFDPKDRFENNTNYIPTFQNKESWITASSYVIDDYFGYLDDNEGNDAIGVLDIGIGRLPVKTVDEAQDAISKIKRYLRKGEPYFGQWRTKTCMVADDQDGSLHLDQADSLSKIIPDYYNQNKIYLDSYYQISTPSGPRFPDVTEAINNQMDKGALIMNYVGHGGKSGWAHERILQISDIQSWSNDIKLPLFITATCEFSRFDEPEFESAGELVFLNPNGGGIALLTTTRLAYSQSNFSLNLRVYNDVFTRVNGELPYLGDLIMRSKPPGQLSTRNFILMGDPALKLAYPEFNVVTTEINGEAIISQSPDTLMALEEVNISGEIKDFDGNKIENFNGLLLVSAYDKPTLYHTIGNDAGSQLREFTCQDKVIWNGNVTVTNGDFNFSFIIPKDIAMNFGKGKISYYAYSEMHDAFGYYNDFIIGGIDENAEPDNQGPQIDLYITDSLLISDYQNDTIKLLTAFLTDPHGINLSENGIGHDITMVINDDYTNVMVMNDYFEPETNSFQSGTLIYQFDDLANGEYKLTLEAWDNYNNSNEAAIGFVVERNAYLLVGDVKNYPNPFAGSTTFSFQHTRPGDDLGIRLDIFDITGKKVTTYYTITLASNSTGSSFTWDGSLGNGSHLKNGVYLYTLTVTDEIENVSTYKSKLIISK